MISKICLSNVASYKKQTVLETDKKVNLIYGLNGTGKSIFSDFLYNPKDPKYKDCSIDGLNEYDEICVYNQSFVQENFFEDLKGIFTLSKINKDAETIITNSNNEIKKLTIDKDTKEKELENEKLSYSKKQEKIKDKIWEIKKNYAGGDRVLEFCLDGYKNDSNRLLSFVALLEKPINNPSKTIDNLKRDVQELIGNTPQEHSPFQFIPFISEDIEKDPIHEKQIVGNENSSISELIKNLGNPDWVKDGLQYLPNNVNENSKGICPFCQERTITTDFLKKIEAYFDKSYESDLNKILNNLNEYKKYLNLIQQKSKFESNPMYEKLKKDFEIKFNSLIKIVKENIKLLEEKIKTPSIPVSLLYSNEAVEEINTLIKITNDQIIEHNKKIGHIDKTKIEIKKTFWEIIRWDYDQTISEFLNNEKIFKKNYSLIEKTINELKNNIKKQNEIIIEQQKLTINIEDAIHNINNGLINLGIEEFKIIPYNNLYKIVRGNDDKKIFNSLSEGEKMIISFLYFLELCKGKKDINETNNKKKIIVIDDPISSLSHIYVYNIGRFIHDEFLRTDKYEQIFILTHSLYFFYDLTNRKSEEREKCQKLLRLRKNASGSEFIKMKYEEIQNDYHAYWNIIKDQQQPPALIANCMRNIIDYFFNFVEKNDLNNVFQKHSMQENRFKSFNRYINRESHSSGQNIFDIKEFNYDDFKDAFKLVFIENGYEEHYKRMIK